MAPSFSTCTPPDAIRLLSDDHKEVEALFRAYERLVRAEAGGDDRRAVAEQICALLTVHESIEEEIFYPAARAADVDTQLLDEAVVEHGSAKDVIGQLRAMSPDEPMYDTKVSVLGAYIRHHVAEEQNAMFLQCRRADMDLQGLGEQLHARRSALLKSLGVAA